MAAALTGIIIMIIYSGWMLPLQQGTVPDHTRPGAQVPWLGLYETEAEGARVVISNSVEGKVQIPQIGIFVLFLPLAPSPPEGGTPARQFLGLL